ncbi:hypothetical protein HK100_009536, partial [Physocladia obscura]
MIEPIVVQIKRTERRQLVPHLKILGIDMSIDMDGIGGQKTGGNGLGELIIGETQHLQAFEAAEHVWNGATQLVVGQVQDDQGLEVFKGLGDGAGEQVSGQVEALERDEGTDPVGDGAGHAEAAHGEDGEVGHGGDGLGHLRLDGARDVDGAVVGEVERGQQRRQGDCRRQGHAELGPPEHLRRLGVQRGHEARLEVPQVRAEEQPPVPRAHLAQVVPRRRVRPREVREVAPREARRQDYRVDVARRPAAPQHPRERHPLQYAFNHLGRQVQLFRPACHSGI